MGQGEGAVFPYLGKSIMASRREIRIWIGNASDWVCEAKYQASIEQTNAASTSFFSLRMLTVSLALERFFFALADYCFVL
jgi:hypothetical protein